MEEYYILEAHYQKDPMGIWDNVLREEAKNAQALKALVKTDPYLQSLPEDQIESFLQFASSCNTIAARSLGEISIALHPGTKESSVVIVAERILTVGILKNFFETAVSLSFQVAMEPVEENGKKIMLYFTHAFA